MSPHIEVDSETFPGDPSPQPPFGFRDTIQSLGIWSVGIPHLAFWMTVVRVLARFTDLRKTDPALKAMSRALPALCGVRVEVMGREKLDPGRAYVYVANHVNIFDMFVIYQAVPHYTRALEHVEHFSWPLIGPLLTAAGQIPVDPDNRRVTAAGLKRASEMLERGESVTVLPEGVRTLDGSVGPFLSGAFRMAIKAGVPVVPLSIRGGRAVSRRGEWRIRPGGEQIFIGDPIPTDHLALKDAEGLAQSCREKIIARLHG